MSQDSIVGLLAVVELHTPVSPETLVGLLDRHCEGSIPAQRHAKIEVPLTRLTSEQHSV
jgi:hypothetical protein